LYIHVALCLPIHPLMTFGLFPVWAIMDNVNMNVNVHALHTQQLLCQMIRMCLALTNSPGIQNDFIILNSHKQRVREAYLPQHLALLVFFICFSSKYIAVPHCNFNLHFHDSF
jgi:hypothetical protein